MKRKEVLVNFSIPATSQVKAEQAVRRILNGLFKHAVVKPTVIREAK